MKWPFTKRQGKAAPESLADLGDMIKVFEDLEKEYRAELEQSRVEEDQARALDDEVRREVSRDRINLLQTYLNAILKVRFVIDQVRYMIRFQEGMKRYRELPETVSGVNASPDVKRALDAIHQDLEIIRQSSHISMEKIDGYVETFRMHKATPNNPPKRASESSVRRADGAQEPPSQGETEGHGRRLEDLEKRLRRRLEEN